MSPRSPEPNCTRQDSTSSALPPEVVARVRELEILRLLSDRNAETELIRLIERYPQLSETCGDLGQQAIASWVDKIAGTNLVFRAALRQKVKLLRERFPISGIDPTAEMLASHIVSTWLQSTYADSRIAQSVSLDRAEKHLLANRQQLAKRQHLAAIEAWRSWRGTKFQTVPQDSGSNKKYEAGSPFEKERDILPFEGIVKSA